MLIHEIISKNRVILTRILNFKLIITFKKYLKLSQRSYFTKKNV